MNLNRNNILKIMGLIVFTILLYVGLQNTTLFVNAARYLFGLLSPFMIGGCIAFVLNVPMRFFEKNLFARVMKRKENNSGKLKRTLSLILALVVVWSVISIVLFLVVPELYQSIAAIGRELSYASVRIPQLLDEVIAYLPMFEETIDSIKDSILDIDWKAIGSMLLEFFRNGNILSNTVSIATSVVSGVTNVIIGIVFAIYILMQKENLGRQFRRLFYAFFPEKIVDRFLEICRLTAVSFNSFLSGQCVEAIILGMMFFITMSLFKMPYALVIAVLIGITALIPMFGAFIGCIVGAFLILIVSPMKALWFIILFLVLQQIEGNIIYPRVVGSSVGLPSIWVLAAVTLGASFGGVLGILFAIPIFSVLYTLLRADVRSRIQERKIAQDKIN